MSALEQLVANMSVAQLAEMAGMDVDTMVSLILGKGKGAAPARKTAKKAGRRPGRPPASQAAPAAAEGAAQAPAAAPSGDDGGLNTRTREGRNRLDAAILDFLKEQTDAVRALDIRRGIGGTSAQVRTRLNFLISKKKVTYTGRASGTRYRAK